MSTPRDATGHGGRALIGEGRGFALPEVWCDCGQRFPATRHPVERDHFESPGWEAHVKAAHAAARETTKRLCREFADAAVGHHHTQATWIDCYLNRYRMLTGRRHYAGPLQPRDRRRS